MKNRQRVDEGPFASCEDHSGDNREDRWSGETEARTPVSSRSCCNRFLTDNKAEAVRCEQRGVLQCIMEMAWEGRRALGVKGGVQGDARTSSSGNLVGGAEDAGEGRICG